LEFRGTYVGSAVYTTETDTAMKAWILGLTGPNGTRASLEAHSTGTGLEYGTMDVYLEWVSLW
jgi:hypothetical protein